MCTSFHENWFDNKKHKLFVFVSANTSTKGGGRVVRRC